MTYVKKEGYCTNSQGAEHIVYAWPWSKHLHGDCGRLAYVELCKKCLQCEGRT